MRRDGSPGIDEVRRLTPEPTGVGTEHEFTRTFAGKAMTSRNRYTRYEPGRFVEFEVPDGWLSGRASYLVEPAAAGTLLTSTMTFTAKGAWRIFEPLLRRLLLRDSTHDQVRLAAVLETTAQDATAP